MNRDRDLRETLLGTFDRYLSLSRKHILLKWGLQMYVGTYRL